MFRYWKHYIGQKRCALLRERKHKNKEKKYSWLTMVKHIEKNKTEKRFICAPSRGAKLHNATVCEHVDACACTHTYIFPRNKDLNPQPFAYSSYSWYPPCNSNTWFVVGFRWCQKTWIWTGLLFIGSFFYVSTMGTIRLPHGGVGKISWDNGDVGL